MGTDNHRRFVPANVLSRRRFLGGTATFGVAAAAAGLVGCSSSNNNKNNNAAKSSASAAATAAGAVSSAATTRAGTPAAPAVASRTATPAALDPTKGKAGGSLVVQNSGFPTNYSLVTSRNTSSKIAGLTHNGLLVFNFGHPPSNGVDIGVETDAAASLPEQPDNLTYVFKLQQGIKFQNGRAMTSQDVAYSFDAYAKGDKNGPSAAASNWTWYDSAQTPDPQTVVIKTKQPFAEALLACSAHQDAFILAQEFEEGPDSPKKLLGSGPYLFDSDSPPLNTVLKKNANYWQKPYPYFDQITVLGNTDPSKQISDYVSKQVHLTYYQDAIVTDQIKSNRPDSQIWAYYSSAHAVIPRCDQAPFNDKRVRQALSMAIDRKAIRDATQKGQGTPDQILSPVFGPSWGFRTPDQLGTAAKYWNYDVQAAKQLLAAAGVTQSIDATMVHADASFLGQSFVDTATLAQAQWKQANIASIKDNSISIGQFQAGPGLGNFDQLSYGPSSQQNPQLGVALKGLFWSPPEGVKPPTLNVGHVNDPQLSDLLDKQLQQLDRNARLQTLHSIEDTFAEGQYRIIFSTYPLNYFTDPSLRNAVVPKWTYGGSDHFLQSWWFA